MSYFAGEKWVIRRHPTTNGGMQSGSTVGTRTLCVHVFARFGTDFACSVGAYRQNFWIGAHLEVCYECVVGRVSIKKKESWENGCLQKKLTGEEEGEKR